MEHLKVYLLGAPRIERNGESVKVDTRKAVALLAYLAVTAESHTRDTLSALFWPDSDLSRARGALRRTLSALNRALAGEGLRADRSSVRFEPGAGRWLDFNEFRSRLSTCTAHGHKAVEVCSACLPLLTEATELCRGRLPGGLHPPG